MAVTDLPKLPVAHDGLAKYIANHPKLPMTELMGPFRQYEAKLRELYAQERNSPVLDDPYVNVLPLFTDDTINIKTRARNLEAESPGEKEKYIMSLPDDKRRPDGSPAVVSSLREFRRNFGIFSESSLAEMDWSNVVAAGSSVVNCLLPVPGQYNKSKRALRQYYHEKFCLASDVDLFLYGLTEEQAIEKIKDIEARIRDAILSEVTVVRTKNAITICSQYPTRHVQIVLRVYKSVSEILTGFDIDCSGAAYDGKQVYCTPRALASYITQINPIDLSRRSPSYESRLSKYSHRNFEVYWPELDRSRIDPTIFERSFQRTLGLARLLVLERLPTTNARDEYLRKRREERGRPQPPSQYRHRLRGNIKNFHEDEVADWIDEDDVSNYHTFTIPYGTKFHAKKIEKLCYTKDLLLNAEWNQPKERGVYLHRHPAFFGRVEDVIGDCCGTCPKPQTPEEIETAEKESEIYLSGKVSFRIDDPGRQQIGSFNPLTDDDWTEMAYVGNTARLCQAIVDGDIEHVQDWLSQEGADPNRRDYTGRTPLHLAVISSTPQVVKCLVDSGARLIARLADGRTALHLAAARGDIEMVKILLEKSTSNEEEEEKKQDQRRSARQMARKDSQVDEPMKNNGSDDDGSEAELVTDATSEGGVDMRSVTTGSFVQVSKDDKAEDKAAMALDDDQREPDIYKTDVLAWDSKCSPLHLAVLGGHCELVKLLCQEFGADVLLPVKFGDGSYSNPNTAILTMVLALALPVDQAVRMAKTLLSLGATCSQADASGVTAFHRYIQSGQHKLIDSLFTNDKRGLKAAINHAAINGTWYRADCVTPLMAAVDKGDPILVLKLLEAGARPDIDFDSWLKSAKLLFENYLGEYENNKNHFKQKVEQPLIVAIMSQHPSNAVNLLEKGADPSTLTRSSYYIMQNQIACRHRKGRAALDVTHDLLHQFRQARSDLTGLNEPPEPGRRSGFYSTMRGSYLEQPSEPLGTAEFLAKFENGSYLHWLVSTDIEEKLDRYKEQQKEFEEQKARESDRKGLPEKLSAIEDMISQLERVEKALKAKDAKAFKQQYPDMEEPKESATNQSPSPYSLEFKFNNTKDVTDARKAAYFKLFEAAWVGDFETIKLLTLSSWDADKQEPPLKLAVSDAKNNTPLSLAFLRGHYKVASAILEIVQAQWSPETEKETRFVMGEAEDDDSDEGLESDDDEEPRISEKVIDDQFTIENVGQVSMQVKSHTPASDFIAWPVPTFALRDGSLQETGREEGLLSHTLIEGDTTGFNLLLDAHVRFFKQTPNDDENESKQFYTLPLDQFEDAVRLGRTELLASAIRQTGAGIPLEDLVKKSGAEQKAKPRYYQGLNVYGKKRADWAKAGRNLVAKPAESTIPPLLTAAFHGSLESVEWFVSDAPMRHYLEFGQSKAAKEDPRLKLLNEAPGGFERAIAKWLGAQNDLAIHCAVIGPVGENTNRVIEYLTKVCPSSLEAKTNEGYTPLFLACLLGRVEFAKTLIKAGADQSVKDKGLRNIIHASLTNRPKPSQLRELLDLFDPSLRPHLFLQRSNLASNGDTPLHFWLKTANPLRLSSHDEETDNIETLKVILEYSNGAELGVFNGSGDTVLHTAVMHHLPEHVNVILAQDPELLCRENAVGRTPGEIAHDLSISSKLERPEPLATNPITMDNDQRTSAIELQRRPPETFLDGEPPRASGKKRRDRTWQVTEEYLSKVSRKRRLVSLNEANDVAKRLGESYAWQRYAVRTSSPNEAEADGQQPQGPPKPDFVDSRYRIMQYTAWKSAAELPRQLPRVFASRRRFGQYAPRKMLRSAV
ncbi:ankyrin [Hypoxylon sp. FL1284]|nr:ankyrin [Hypoxylon sp. FL1284]